MIDTETGAFELADDRAIGSSIALRSLLLGCADWRPLIWRTENVIITFSVKFSRLELF